MSDLHSPSQSHQADQLEQADALHVERRRPGRVDNVSPALISMLRGCDAPAPPFELEDGDALAPARGIVAGLVLSSAVWAAVIGSIFVWLH
ncbi:MAG TPA: hypothetical protein VFL55_16765 [Acetobacteraceae bacterium]|nr:hypothetical protein [Acetobacteraceae bacterium]